MTANTKLLYSIIGILSGLFIAWLGYLTKNNNYLGWILFWTGIACITAGCIYLVASLFGKAARVETQDRSMFLLIPGLILICLAPPLEYLFLSAILPRNILFQEIGLFLFCAGVLFCILSRSMLELWDLGDGPKERNLHLTREGAYQVMRYPAFLGFGLIALGLCLGYSSIVGIFCILALLVPGIIFQIRSENRRRGNIIDKAT